MALTAHFCLLVLLVAGPAQGLRNALQTQDAGPRPLKLMEVFKLFQIQFNRSYSNPAEYARRLNIFAHNLAQAQRLQEEDLGTAEFGVTPFSDLTEEEFGQLFGNQRAAKRDPGTGIKVGPEKWRKPVPSTCDWRKAAGVISPIKNQENCRCCWAMAAAGNIEALWSIKYHQPVEVSVQELLDCARCGDGCKGGFVWDAYITVLNQSGLVSEKDYPFEGQAKLHRCLAKRYNPVAWIEDFIMLPKNEQEMAKYLVTHGPITAIINMKMLQHYQRGVLKAKPTMCDPRLPDHYVLLVGFGSNSEDIGAETFYSQPHHPTPYWIVKNSWGTNWGEEGYFRLYRGANTCGVAKYPLTALVGQPNKPRVSCPP